jgi:PAS domain S-box-containing protein
MKTYKAYFSVSENTKYQSFLSFIKNSGLNIQPKVSTFFSPKEAALTDMIFVDEEIARQQCAVLADIKKKNQDFLPVLLLTSKKTNGESNLPPCIDDVIFKLFLPSVWERRLETYMQVRENEKKLHSREENEFKTLFAESQSVMLLIDPETGKIENANQAACRFYGYSHSQLTQMRIQQISLLNNEKIKQELTNAHSNKKNHFVFKHRLADGSVKTVEVYSGKVSHKGKPVLYSIIHDITEKVEAEQLLNESTENYRKFIENAPDIIVFIDKKGIIKFINRRISEYGNYDRKDIVGKPITNFIPPEDAQKAKEAIMRVFNNNQKAPFFTSSLLLKDGERIPVLTKGILLKHKGEMVNMTIIRDISFIKEAESELKESKKTFENIFNNNSVAIYIQNKEGAFLDINKAALEQYGYADKNELLGKTPRFVSAEGKNDLEKIKRYLKKAFDGKPQQFEFWAKSSDGAVFPKLVIVERGTYFGQQVVYNFSFDMSERKRVEEALRESEEKYRSVFKTSSDIISITEFVSGRYIETNDSFKKILGYSREELLGKTSLEMNIWVNPAKRKEMMGALRKQGFIKDMETRFRCKNGTFITGLFSAQLITLQGNEFITSEIRDITYIKQAEEALRESRLLFENLAKISPTGIFRADARGKTTYVNPRWCEITGLSFEQATSKGWADILLPNEREELLARWMNNMATKTSSKEKLRIVRPDGTIRWVLGYAIPEIHNGRFVSYVGTITDITDLVKAEQALRESENKYRSLAETSSDLILSFDVKGKLTFLSPVVKKITGYSVDEVLHRSFWEFIAPEYIESTIEKFNRGVKGADIPLYEIELIHKNGKRIPLELNVTSLFDADGNTIGRLAVARDITDRKKAEKALRESENKYRSLAEASTDMIATYDLEGRITYVNPVVKRVLGYTPEELEGKMFYNLTSKKNQNNLIEIFKKRVKNQAPPLLELDLIHKNGKTVPVEVNPTSIFNAEGEIIERLSIVRDITVRKRAEKNLLLRDKALNSAANAIIITSVDGTIEWTNEAFTSLTGYTIGEALGKRTKDLIESNQQDKTFFDNLNKTVLSGQVWKGEIIDKRKDGTFYTVEEIITPVTNEKGEVEHLIGIMTDITERKKAERELREAKEAAEESSRLKSAFLANMNHEIRTPMNAIMGFSELMLEASSEEKENYAQIVNKSAGQLMNLIDDVIFLSRLQSEKLPVKKMIFYPVDLINEIFLMFDLPEMKKNLQLQTLIPEDAGTVTMYSDASKIRQVMTNFTSNAIKYTSRGYVKLGFEMHENSILFFVEDSGMGVPEEEQQHIFRAFYRGNLAVSSAIRGTGLGLNIAKELVELMDGTIGVISQPGKGSRFYFTLPYETPELSVADEGMRKPKLGKWKDLNILIAEDDETNYLYLEILLRDKVNRVDRAQNGQEAVEMAQQNMYSLILMDLKMPVMSGNEATREIKKLFPHLPVIATTAYATQEEKESALAAGCDDYLSKPINKADITALIDKYVSGES